MNNTNNTTLLLPEIQFLFLAAILFMTAQSEKESDTKRGVAVDLRAEVTNIAAGVKTEGAAAERSEAAAETERAGTAGAPPGTTRSTG